MLSYRAWLQRRIILSLLNSWANSISNSIQKKMLFFLSFFLRPLGGPDSRLKTFQKRTVFSICSFLKNKLTVFKKFLLFVSTFVLFYFFLDHFYNFFVSLIFLIFIFYVLFVTIFFNTRSSLTTRFMQHALFSSYADFLTIFIFFI